jgi:uncharacterized membrane protein YecN with MAPEG domain
MPLITALVAAPLLLLIAGLGMAISMRRRRERIGPGMAGDATFIRLQRAHGNAVEHSPLLLLAMLLLELLGARSAALIAFGAAIVVARAAHAAGILQRPRHPLHTLGGALTYTLEVAMAVSLVLTAMRRVPRVRIAHAVQSPAINHCDPLASLLVCEAADGVSRYVCPSGGYPDAEAHGTVSSFLSRPLGRFVRGPSVNTGLGSLGTQKMVFGQFEGAGIDGWSSPLATASSSFAGPPPDARKQARCRWPPTCSERPTSTATGGAWRSGNAP